MRYNSCVVFSSGFRLTRSMMSNTAGSAFARCAERSCRFPRVSTQSLACHCQLNRRRPAVGHPGRARPLSVEHRDMQWPQMFSPPPVFSGLRKEAPCFADKKLPWWPSSTAAKEGEREKREAKRTRQNRAEQGTAPATAVGYYSGKLSQEVEDAGDACRSRKSESARFRKRRPCPDRGYPSSHSLVPSPHMRVSITYWQHLFLQVLEVSCTSNDWP